MERTELQNRPHLLEQLRQNEQTIMELQQRIKELEDGLRPFVNILSARGYDKASDDFVIDFVFREGRYHGLTVGDFRRAASLLPEKKTND